MPGPTARPRGGVVGRAIMDRVSGSRWVSGRSERCVLASLSRSCRGTVEGEEHGLVSIAPRAECARPEMNSPGGHELVAASAGSEGFRLDRHALIRFGLFGAVYGRACLFGRIGSASKDGDAGCCDREDGGLEKRTEFSRCGGDGGTAGALCARWRHGGICRLHSRPGLGHFWAWAWALVQYFVSYIFYYFVFLYVFCTLFLVLCGFMPTISSYHYMVGRRGLGPDMHTQCALSGLARRRAICLIKWTQPPSGRMKLSAVGFVSVRQHSGKAVLFVMMLLRYRVIFPVCHRYVKANGVAIRALFANWCLLEYIDFVESPGIISGCSLYAYCNLGFRLYVPPLYSAISLIKA